MADEGKKNYPNIFIANTIYPEARSIFSFHLEPIEKIKDNCIVVLDTNVLLAPYIIGKEDLLEQCRETYGSLARANRLIIPGQVVREFARNRQEKLAELYQQLSRKKQVELKLEKYPLLSSLKEFREAIRLANDINNKINDYRNTIDKVLAIIQGWHWNDPVSMLYHEIFSEETILDVPISEDDVRKDLDTRQQHDIPPGYKDAGKKDEGVGDLLIWYTILEVGKLNNKSVIFVSGDEKADWYKKSEGQPLYPRYELVDEFRRISGGQSFHIVKFSRFLELFGATEKVVEEIKKEEKVLTAQNVIKEEETLASRNTREKYYQKEQMRELIRVLESIDRELIIYSDDTFQIFNLEVSRTGIRHYFERFLAVYDFILPRLPTAELDIKDMLVSIKQEIISFLRMRVALDDDSSSNRLISEASALRAHLKRAIIQLKYNEAIK